MKLFFSPGACSLAPHILLRETGADFTLVEVDTAAKTTAGGADYLAINPKGQVPLLVLDDGQSLSEGPVIAQYIADLAGATSLMPAAGTLARYRVMEWQNHITSELHKSFTPLFNPVLPASAKDVLRPLLRKKYEWLESRLVPGGGLTAAPFTAADAYLFTVSRWAGHVGLDLSDLPALQRFMASVAERPAVRAALMAEGLTVRT